MIACSMLKLTYGQCCDMFYCKLAGLMWDEQNHTLNESTVTSLSGWTGCMTCLALAMI